jgi:glutathione S-transferase
MGVPDSQKFACFPHVRGWHEAMVKKPAWKKAMETRARLMDEQGLDWDEMPKEAKSFEEYETSIAAMDLAANK